MLRPLCLALLLSVGFVPLVFAQQPTLTVTLIGHNPGGINLNACEGRCR